MEFDITSSPLHIWFMIGAFAGLLGCVATLISTIKNIKVAYIMFAVFALVSLGSSIASIVDESSYREENNTKFSQQLMDEYGATSARALSSMRTDFEKYNEATTTFTRDGSDTTVFVKKVSEKDGKLTMAFTVLDEKALYPKSAE